MAIETVSYGKKCKTTRGGIKRIYIVPYVFYSTYQIQHSEGILTVFPLSDAYQYDVTGTFTQDSAMEEGAYYINQTVEVNLYEVNGFVDVVNFLKQDYRVVAETNNGDHVLFGAYNGLEATATNGSGGAKEEFNGFNLSFTGKEETFGLFADDFQSYFTPISDTPLGGIGIVDMVAIYNIAKD